MKTSEMVRATVHPRTRTQLCELPIKWDFSSCLKDPVNDLVAIEGNYEGMPVIFQKRSQVRKNTNRGNIELQIIFENGIPITGHNYRQLIHNFHRHMNMLERSKEQPGRRKLKGKLS